MPITVLSQCSESRPTNGPTIIEAVLCGKVPGVRSTQAVGFYIAGLPIRAIAEILGWSEDNVEKIIRRYVARGAATRAVIRQLNEARGGTNAAKPAAKLSGKDQLKA